MKFGTSLILIILLAAASCKSPATEKIDTPPKANSIVRPPVDGIDVPFKEYTIDAAKGDTIFYRTGSILLFPPNAFVDKEGHVIQGNVKVRYREFTDGLDLYLSGIPMNYDSAGKSYLFASAGMCEITACKDSIPVFVNPEHKPEINLASSNASPGYNLYLLDTAQGKWTYKGASAVTGLRMPGEPRHVYKPVNESEPAEPVMPAQANDKDPVIRIVIDPASFKELSIYNNLRFQLEDNGKKFNPADTTQEWNKVELEKTSTKGWYIVKFSNARKTVSYKARPVLDEKDYDSALKTFEKNNAAYSKWLKKKLNDEKKAKKQFVKDSLQNQKTADEDDRIARLNMLIDARNKKTDALNAIIDSQNRKTLDENQMTRVLRGFNIDGFGIWNCDMSWISMGIPVKATFKDSGGHTLELGNIAIIHRNTNSIARFYTNDILIAREDDNMIVGVYKGRFAYISYKDCKALNIGPETKEQTFVMTIVSEKNNNYTYIKGIGSGL